MPLLASVILLIPYTDNLQTGDYGALAIYISFSLLVQIHRQHPVRPGRRPRGHHLAEKSRSVKLAFELDCVTLTVRNMEAGQGVEQVEIGYSEEPLEIGLYARYLLDIASQLEGDHARFMLADPASPTMVRDASDNIALYVLMPMRV